MLTSLREGQAAIGAEVRPLLQAGALNRSVLERLLDVADEHTECARRLWE